MLAECGLSAPGHKNVDGLTVRDIAKKHKLDKVLQYLDRNEKREAPPGKLSAIRKLAVHPQIIAVQIESRLTQQQRDFLLNQGSAIGSSANGGIRAGTSFAK